MSSKTAAEAAQAALANRQPSSVSTPQPSPFSPSREVSLFWRRMAEMYGHKWTSSQGETPTELWSRAISQLSAAQIKRGLSECLRSAEAWPPSLPEFLALCRPSKRENAGMYSTAPMLPQPHSDPETARRNLSALRRSLGR